VEDLKKNLTTSYPHPLLCSEKLLSNDTIDQGYRIHQTPHNFCSRSLVPNVCYPDWYNWWTRI